MTQATLITIITVTSHLIEAGRKETFIQCAASVKEQDYPYIQHLIIDNASNDGTVELLENLGLEYISEPDEGLYDAMNKGVLHAKGDYIAFLNSDDFYHDIRMISACVKALKKDDLDFVCSNTYLMSEKNEIENDLTFFVDFKKIFEAMPFGHPSLFCKKEILKKYPFDLKYKLAADYDFVFKLFLNRYNGIALPFTFVTFRMGGACYHTNIKQENIKIREYYLPMKDQILSYAKSKANKTMPQLSIITMYNTLLSSHEEADFAQCKESVKRQSYACIEHVLFKRKSNNYSHDLKCAIAESHGDYVLCLSLHSTLKSTTAIEDIMAIFREEEIQALYFNLETKNERLAYTKKDFLFKRKNFLDILIPYQAFVYRKNLFNYADFSREEAFNDFKFHLKLFVEEGFAYARMEKELVSIPFEEIVFYCDDEKVEQNKKFIPFLNKRSLYEQVVWKKRVKLFNKITLLRIIENMWEKKYYLLGCVLVKTVKK